MLHSEAGWTIGVHREFEDVISAWKNRSHPNSDVGVLHVGFSRPPTREFDHLIDGQRGRLIITASAKFSLPEGYTASDGVLEVVGDLPVYLGVRGWGYEISESELPRATRTVPRARGTPEAMGWVKAFCEIHPNQVNLLSDQEICDDQSYLEKEGALPRELRRALGIFRFEQLTGVDKSDPCDFARASPPWLAQRKFDTIDLPVRVANVFDTMRIEDIADLGELDLETLLRLKNFGRKSAGDLLLALRAALDEGPIHTDSDFASSSTLRASGTDRPPRDDGEPHQGSLSDVTLMDAIQVSLLRFDEREREIVSRRMGLGYPAETLQEIGVRFNVTRERIRQIEAKAVARLIKREVWDDELTARLAALIQNRTMPLPLRGLDGADPWFEGMGNEGEVLAYLLANVSRGPAKIIEIDGTQYIGSLTQQEWDQACDEARRLLSSGVEHNWSEEHCRTVVGALLPERCREFRDLLWDQATRHAHFSDESGTIVLSGFGKGAENYVYAVLADSPTPLHYSEFPALIQEKYDRTIDVRRAHNAAAEVGFLLGRGVYGLEKHIQVPPETLKGLAEDAYEIIADGPPDRQWHVSELVSEISERSGVEVVDVDKYILNIALVQFSNLQHLGRFVWTLKDSSSDTARIDLRQAIAAVLEEAGHPLKGAEIRKRLSESRGVNELFQIPLAEPIIRVAPDTWGLNDRDVSVKRPDQKRFHEVLVSLLRSRGIGIHFSELSTFRSLASWGLTDAAIVSLAVRDPRIRLSPGRYVYLQEWGEPRRESLRDALTAVLAESHEPLRTAEIGKLVAIRLGREVDRSAISSQLQAAEAVFNPEEGTWTAAPEDIVDAEGMEGTKPESNMAAVD